MERIGCIKIREQEMGKTDSVTAVLALIGQRHLPDELHLFTVQLFPCFIIIIPQIFHIGINIDPMLHIQFTVAFQTNNPAGFQQFQTFHFFVSALKNIPQKDRQIHVLRFDLLKNRPQRFQVPMNIGKYSNLHSGSFLYESLLR